MKLLALLVVVAAIVAGCAPGPDAWEEIWDGPLPRVAAAGAGHWGGRWNYYIQGDAPGSVSVHTIPTDAAGNVLQPGHPYLELAGGVSRGPNPNVLVVHGDDLSPAADGVHMEWEMGAFDGVGAEVSGGLTTSVYWVGVGFAFRAGVDSTWQAYLREPGKPSRYIDTGAAVGQLPPTPVATFGVEVAADNTATWTLNGAQVARETVDFTAEDLAPIFRQYTNGSAKFDGIVGRVSFRTGAP